MMRAVPQGRRRGVLGFVPMLGVLWIVYNVMLLLGAVPEGLARPLFGVPLPSGAAVTVSRGELLIGLGLLALYIEMLKATRTGTASVIEHSVSVLVFIAFLVEFLVVAGAGTATFGILGLMSLLDVIAGFSISIYAARRDLAIDA